MKLIIHLNMLILHVYKNNNNKKKKINND